MKKSKKHTLITNILIILGSLVTSLGLYYLLNTHGLLDASILSISDYQTIKENNWDIGYKTQNNHIEIFCSDNLPRPNKDVIFHIIYDKNNITIHKNQATYQNKIDFKSDSGANDKSIISMTNISNIDCKESLIDIPFDGVYKNIIIDKIFWDNTAMKIGNLNDKIQHENL